MCASALHGPRHSVGVCGLMRALADPGYSVPVVRLVERSTTAVSRQVFEEIAADESLFPLLEEGVLSLVRSRTTPFGVRCGAWVGRVRLPSGLELLINEKVRGSLLGLLEWAAPSRVRAVNLPSPASDLEIAQGALADRFLAATERYLASGRHAHYAPLILRGTTPQGRLDIGQTLRIRAGGRPTTVVSHASRLSRRDDCNDLLAGAISLAELACDALHEIELVARARNLSHAFGDCDGGRWLRRLPTVRAEALDRALGSLNEEDPMREALAYARIFLLNLGVWDGERPEHMPQGFFLSLETLFEEAVLAAARLTWSNRVVRGRDLRVQLFPELPRAYTVDPDLVLLHTAAESVAAAVDVKFKEKGALPAHADVYQLVAHASALGARHAALVYPGAYSAQTRLGRTASGVEVIVLEVSMDNLREDLMMLGALAMDESVL